MRFVSILFYSVVLSVLSCGIKPPNIKELHGISMIYISKVRFTMGTDYLTNKVMNEKPPHEVVLYPFYISAKEITNAEYAAYLNEKLALNKHFPRDYSGSMGQSSWITFKRGKFGVVKGKENLPVVYVTWFDAYNFAEHYGLRLPTEAEWECAAQGGKKLPYGNKTGEADVNGILSNYNNFIGTSVAVGSYQPNPFGLYDMSGNVREWCLDKFDAYFYSITQKSDNSFVQKRVRKNPLNSAHKQSIEERIIRGGAFDSHGFSCRSSAREYMRPDLRDVRTGFRVVLSYYDIGS